MSEEKSKAEALAHDLLMAKQSLEAADAYIMGLREENDLLREQVEIANKIRDAEVADRKAFQSENERMKKELDPDGFSGVTIGHYEWDPVTKDLRVVVDKSDADVIEELREQVAHLEESRGIEVICVRARENDSYTAYLGCCRGMMTEADTREQCVANLSDLVATVFDITVSQADEIKRLRARLGSGR